jgi:hypothetical protein
MFDPRVLSKAAMNKPIGQGSCMQVAPSACNAIDHLDEPRGLVRHAAVLEPRPRRWAETGT